MSKKASSIKEGIKVVTGENFSAGGQVDNRSMRQADSLEYSFAQHKVELRKLRKEIADRTAELTIINSIQTALASRLEVQSIYDLVGDEIRKIFNAQVVMISTYDPETRTMEHRYAIERDERVYAPGPHPLRGFRIQIVETRKPVLVNTNVAEQAARLGQYTLPGTITPKSWLGVPMLVGDQVRGILSLQNVDEENAFDEADIRLLETLANSMSVALENAQLFDETQRLLKETEQRAQELAILNSVGEAMAKTLDVKTVTQIVGDKVLGIFDTDSVIIMLLDRQTNLIHVPYEYDKNEGGYIDYVEPFPLGTGLSSKVISSRQPLMLGTLEDEIANGAYFPPEIIEKGEGKFSQSWLGVPIITNDQVLGLVALAADRPHAFHDNQLYLLQTLSSNMGVAIENARLFQAEQQRAAELATVNTVSAALVRELDLAALIELVGEQVRSVFKADIAYVALLDKESGTINFPYQYGQRLRPLRLGEGLTSRIIQSGQPLLINQELDRQRKQLGVKLIGKQAQSYLGVPIFLSGKPIGVVSVQSVTQEGRFTENDQRLLGTIAANVGIALQNARLWEQENLYRKALQRELEIGREIQAGFLPEALPIIEGWEIAASLMSAREVAGDFYDAFELPDGKVGLVIADVCDKGVGAALFMTLFRSLIRAASNLDAFERTRRQSSLSTAERLQRAMSLTNNYIAETHGKSGMFATLFFGILDPGSGKLTYINGGHEPPLIIRSGVPSEILSKTGPAVGAIINSNFKTIETRLDTGDMLFAFTDGVPDCKDPHGDFFGRERLLNLIQGGSGSSQELIKCVETELHQYIDHSIQFDDITLLAVKHVL